MGENKNEVDLYRDTYLRYMGYTNEVGEAFRSIIPKSIVLFSYIVSSGYVVADTLDKGLKGYSVDTSSHKIQKVLISASDALLWQTFASIIIPGYTVNRICSAVQFMQKMATNVALKNRWVAPMVGMSSIPFIVHPIDDAVEYIMDASYRKLTGYHPKKPSV